MSGDLGQVSPHSHVQNRQGQTESTAQKENWGTPLLSRRRAGICWGFGKTQCAGNPKIPSWDPEMVEMVENWKAHHLWEAPPWRSSCSGHADIEPH